MKILGFWACVWVFATAAFAAEAQPKLKLREGAPTSAVARKQRLELGLRELALYREHTTDPDEARAAAEEFLRVGISIMTDQLPGEDAPAGRHYELHTLAKAAVAAGSQDPLVMMYYSDALRINNLSRQALTKANRRWRGSINWRIRVACGSYS